MLKQQCIKAGTIDEATESRALIAIPKPCVELK